MAEDYKFRLYHTAEAFVREWGVRSGTEPEEMAKKMIKVYDILYERFKDELDFEPEFEIEYEPEFGPDDDDNFRQSSLN